MAVNFRTVAGATETLRHNRWGIPPRALSLLCLLSGVQAASLNVIVSSETIPPGATAQIQISLAQPAAISSGEVALNLDPRVFGPVTAVATFSAVGDAGGYATINGSTVDLHFYSPSATMGSAAGMPLAVITVPTLSTAAAGAQAILTPDPSGSPWEGGDTANDVAVTPGAVTIGGALSVSDVSPVSNLSAGAVVTIRGTGFTSATTVGIAAVSVAAVQFSSPQEIDVTLTGAADLGGKRITVTNADGSQVDFFAAPPTTPLPTTASPPFNGAIPVVPTASYTAGRTIPIPPSAGFGWIVIENTSATPVGALIYAGPGSSIPSVVPTITIPAGGAYVNDFRSLQADGVPVLVLATAPLRMLQLVAGFFDEPMPPPPRLDYIGALTPTYAAPLNIYMEGQPPIQFTWVTGAAAPPPQTFPLEVSQGAFTASPSGGNWLSVTTSGGANCPCSGGSITIGADPTGLAPGVYYGTVTVAPVATPFEPAGPSILLAVVLTVSTGIGSTTPVLEAAAPAVFLSAAPFNPVVANGAFSVEPPVGFTVQAITSNGGGWLSASPQNAPGPTNQIVGYSVDASHLDTGVYHGTISISIPGQSISVPVTLTVSVYYTPNGTYDFLPVLGSVLNSSSYIQGAIAPGEIITLRGVGFSDTAASFTLDSQGNVPVELADTQVLVNGKPAPVLWTSGSQINAIVPYEVAGGTSATVQAIYAGGSAAWSVPLAAAAPGIFTLDWTGGGQAAALNQDDSVNGPDSPAPRGSTIRFFATGIPVAGAVAGSVTPSEIPNATPPVSVTIGGVSAAVQYAGPVAWGISGLIEVDATVPETVPPGPAVPIVLSVGSGPVFTSQAGVTIGVQ